MGKDSDFDYSKFESATELLREKEKHDQEAKEVRGLKLMFVIFGIMLFGLVRLLFGIGKSSRNDKSKGGF